MLRPRIVLRLFGRYAASRIKPFGTMLLAAFIIAAAAGIDFFEASENYARLKQYERGLAGISTQPAIPRTLAPAPAAPQTMLPFRIPAPYDPNDIRHRLRPA